MTRSEALRQEFINANQDSTWEDQGIDYVNAMAEDFQPNPVPQEDLPVHKTQLNRPEGGRFANAIKSAKAEGTPKERWW